MIGGVFITGKRYSWADYLSAGMLAAGVALFSSAGGHVSKAAGDEIASTAAAAAAAAVVTGAMILSVTLCCDALLGNFQEKVMRDSAINPVQMMALQSIFGMGLAFACCIATGELEGGIQVMRGVEGPRLGSLFVLYAFCLLAGTVAVLSLVEEFGAAAAVTVTLLRKVLSMGLSYIIWPKPLSAAHVWGAGLVFFSPLLHNVIKPSSGPAREKAGSKGAAGARAGELERGASTAKEPHLTGAADLAMASAPARAAAASGHARSTSAGGITAAGNFDDSLV